MRPLRIIWSEPSPKTSFFIELSFSSENSSPSINIKNTTPNSATELSSSLPLNPKVALFFLSFLPQFIEPQNQYGALPFILLGLTFILTGTIWLLILVYFSASITTLLRQSSAAAKLMDKVCGSIYLLLGIKLLAAERE